jgi:hypothetical protein
MVSHSAWRPSTLALSIVLCMLLLKTTSVEPCSASAGTRTSTAPAKILVLSDGSTIHCYRRQGTAGLEDLGVIASPSMWAYQSWPSYCARDREVVFAAKPVESSGASEILATTLRCGEGERAVRRIAVGSVPSLSPDCALLSFVDASRKSVVVAYPSGERVRELGTVPKRTRAIWIDSDRLLTRGSNSPEIVDVRTGTVQLVPLPSAEPVGVVGGGKIAVFRSADGGKLQLVQISDMTIVGELAYPLRSVGGSVVSLAADEGFLFDRQTIGALLRLHESTSVFIFAGGKEQSKLISGMSILGGFEVEL